MENYEFLKERAVKHLNDGQAFNALPIAEIMCELKPNDKENHTLRARALLEVREFDSVTRVVKYILDEWEPDVGTLTLGIKASFELGDIKGCISFAESLLALENGNTLSLCYLGKCAELSGDAHSAIWRYRSALDSDPFCGEAIMALIERKLLDNAELNNVIDSLRLPTSAETLRTMYKAKINTVIDGNTVVPAKVLLLQRAQTEYEKNNLRVALSHVSELLENDPYNREGTCLYLSILVDMKATPKLFEKAHFLSKSTSRAELAVYAIGCFYYSLSNYERAGRYFCRAAELDFYFAEAWIAYGHCYAKLEEGEQALVVYRRALILFPGLSVCATFVGMQYSRTHQWPVALSYFEEPLKATPSDPLVLNEVAVLYTRTRRLHDALHLFQRAYESLPNPENPSEHRDCILFNVATVLRKLGNYTEAIKYYNKYVACRPNASHAHCALGFTFHLSGNSKAAIAHYHTALSIKPDSFCREMLDRALSTDFSHSAGGTSWGVEGGHHSPSPGEVSFLTVSRTLRSGSDTGTLNSAAASPRPSVGRSLNF